MKIGIARIPGKTVAAVVTAANPLSPRHQMFLVFTDGTQLELRGECLSSAPDVQAGGLLQAIEAARRAGGEIQVFAQECAPQIESLYELFRTKH